MNFYVMPRSYHTDGKEKQDSLLFSDEHLSSWTDATTTTTTTSGGVNNIKQHSDFIFNLLSDDTLHVRFVTALRAMYPTHASMLEQVFSRDAMPPITSSCRASAPTAAVIAAMERRIQSCVRRQFWDNVNGSQVRPMTGLRRPSRRALPRTSPYATASSLLDCRPCMNEVQHNVVAGSIRRFKVRRGLTRQLSTSTTPSGRTIKTFESLVFNWDDVIFARGGGHHAGIVYNQSSFEFYLLSSAAMIGQGKAPPHFRVDDVPHEVFVVEKVMSRSERSELLARPRMKNNKKGEEGKEEEEGDFNEEDVAPMHNSSFNNNHNTNNSDTTKKERKKNTLAVVQMW
eukprot:PhM_4_TR18464/c0_g1_i2/m.77185